ncbi:alanine dehydrogenase [Hutsoniella sourekii]
MIIGVPKEIKNNENRVAIAPGNVANLVHSGHKIYIEKGAGEGSFFSDEDYAKYGAEIKDTAEEVWAAEMVLKVKEPLKEEYKYFREDLILMTYLHLASDEELTTAVVESGMTAVAYETMVLNGTLPLLAPMSEVAGSYAIQAGAHYLESRHGGKGILLGGVPGVSRGKVVIIGGGKVGEYAARIALGMGAEVTVLDLNPARLAELKNIFQGNVNTVHSDAFNIAREVKDADIVLGSVLIPGKKAPILVTKEMIQSMEPGSVVIDVAIDQGGNFETSDHATTHDDPIYVREGIIHYTVANIPGAVPQTSTLALTNATMRYVTEIANKGIVQAAKDNTTIYTGINAASGKLTNEAVAETSHFDYVEYSELV